MANIFVNQDALFFTAPAALTTNYSQLSTQGYAYTSFKSEWMGTNLIYTQGTILPTSGTITYVSASKLDGTNLFTASNFSIDVSTLPTSWSIDYLTFVAMGPLQANTITGSVNNDTLPALSPGDFLNGGQGQDTILLFGLSTEYSVAVTSVNNSSGIVTVLRNGNTFEFSSMEKIAFTDKTVNVSDYIIYTPTQYKYTLSLIVDKGILGADAVILSNLTELKTYSGSNLTSHTVQYGNSIFNFNDIDALVTTVVRDGNFTAEFQKEIADLAPSAANITYTDAVSLIGVANIVNTLIYVAGADGNFVS